jgi:TolB protein
MSRGKCLLGALLATVLLGGCSLPSQTTARSAAPSAAPSVAPRASIVGSLYAVRGYNLWRFQGTTARQLTRSGDVVDPAVSTDGSHLAFIRRGRSYSDLWLADADAQNARAVTRHDGGSPARAFWAFRPAWSPDGAAIAFVSDRGRHVLDYPDPVLWLYQPEGARFRALSQANPLAGGDTDATWSPAGDALLYTSYLYELVSGPIPKLSARLTYCDPQPKRRCDIFLSPPAERNFQPAWSPDGKWVAFVRGTGAGDDLYVMPAPAREDLRGTPPFPTARATLLVSGMVGQPAWSPDGNWLAYLAVNRGGVDLLVARFLTAPAVGVSPAVPVATHGGFNAESRLSWGP